VGGTCWVTSCHDQVYTIIKSAFLLYFFPFFHQFSLFIKFLTTPPHSSPPLILLHPLLTLYHLPAPFSPSSLFFLLHLTLHRHHSFYYILSSHCTISPLPSLLHHYYSYSTSLFTTTTHFPPLLLTLPHHSFYSARERLEALGEGASKLFDKLVHLDPARRYVRTYRRRCTYVCFYVTTEYLFTILLPLFLPPSNF
jgi:hypothetical protein